MKNFKVILCAIAKCENQYLSEWVDYNLKLGFDKIVIYDNNDLNGECCKDALSDEQLKQVEIVNYRGKEQQSCETQIEAYNSCYRRYCDYDWIIFLDIDEFLCLDKYKNIKIYLNQSWIQRANAIRFHWKCYTDNGLIYNDNRPVQERFTEVCPNNDVNAFTKTMFRTNLGGLKIVNVHYSSPIGNIFYPNGTHAAYMTQVTDKNIVLEGGHVKHYVTKSVEEFVTIKYKRRKKGISKTRLSKDMYFKYNVRTKEKEEAFDKMLRELIDKEKSEMDYKEPINDTPNTAAELVLIPSVVKGVNKPIVKKPIERTFDNVKEQQKPIIKEDTIIVSFTSWIKRIKYCKHTVELMLAQTMKPDKIILNLSSDEFPNKEEDLPKDLVEMQNDVFEIYWVKENTKVYKKTLPTLNRFPNDVIVSIDDDVEYPNKFIEEEYTVFVEHGKACPVTAGKYKWNDMYSHHGCFSMIKKDFFGKYIDDLYENVVLKYGFDVIPFSDPLFTYAALLNKRRYVFTDKYNMNAIRCNSNINKENRLSEVGTKEYNSIMMNEHSLYKRYISDTYNKTYENLTKNHIIVSFTTWTKRDMAAAKMIEHFKKQTMKPDKIVCWLSSDEYCGENVPKSLQKYVNDKTIEIRWVKENTYCHKRYEIFKEHKNDYVFLIDDDIYYEPTYLQTMYEVSLKHSGNIICYLGNEVDYKKDRILKRVEHNPSLKNTILSGLSCYPPNVFPMEYFEYIDVWNELCPKCDDSALTLLMIKNDIPVFCIYDRSIKSFKQIENTMNDGIWMENKVITNGVSKKVSILKSLLKKFDIVDKAHKLWHNFVIEDDL